MKSPLDIGVLKKIPNPWLRIAVQMFVLGSVITIALSLFFVLMRSDYELSFKDLSITFLFSFIIPLSIGYIAFIFSEVFEKFTSLRWLNLFLYYFIMSVGMFIGTEIVYLILHYFYDVNFNFLAQIPQLKFNLYISLLIGTILYVIDFKEEYYESSLKEKQLQLLRLNEMKSKAELQSLQSRINPHFLYNSLNGIASLIHEDQNLAEAMLIKLAKLFRYTINSNSETMVSLEKELEIVKLYIDLEEMRFSDRFSFELNIEDGLLNESIPRYLLQPLIENSFKHGISAITGIGKIEVAIRKVNSRLNIEIKDNGSAFPEPISMGYGLLATYDSLSLIYKKDFTLEFLNTPEKKIKLSFPVA